MTDSSPFAVLQRIAGGHSVPRCLHVVADMGVADALDESPRTAAELAASVGAHPGALGRVLRLLSSHGIFEADAETFRHSPASRLLRSDHPQSMRALVRMLGFPATWAVYRELEHSVRTGRPAAEKVLPEGLWAYLGEHPELGSIFNAAMAGKAHSQVAGVINACDFSGFGMIGDIGGGSGHLLRAVLDVAPQAKGVLFDLPNVIAEAADIASDRLRLQAGDFFRDPLPVCDAYLVMEIIHDWPDEQATAILAAMRRAAPAHARLLLIEQMISADPGPDWAKMLDIHMLALLGGQQRTLQEYEVLLARAGFSFTREIETGAGVSVLEATPA
ncbi:MAG TPA: methyltransferase [Rhodanobacteraceae bacterium]|nr:methyltransferase [Rhodanobacteraceae bacterium]